MIRTDHRGVTSIISALKLKPALYHTVLHFFRSEAYQTEALSEKWATVAMKHCDVVRVANRVIMLGDHSKVPKEGLRMPGIQTLHQESQNSGKPEYILDSRNHNYDREARGKKTV